MSSLTSKPAPQTGAELLVKSLEAQGVVLQPLADEFQNGKEWPESAVRCSPPQPFKYLQGRKPRLRPFSL